MGGVRKMFGSTSSASIFPASSPPNSSLQTLPPHKLLKSSSCIQLGNASPKYSKKDSPKPSKKDSPERSKKDKYIRYYAWLNEEMVEKKILKEEKVDLTIRLKDLNEKSFIDEKSNITTLTEKKRDLDLKLEELEKTKNEKLIAYEDAIQNKPQNIPSFYEKIPEWYIARLERERQLIKKLVSDFIDKFKLKYSTYQKKESLFTIAQESMNELQEKLPLKTIEEYLIETSTALSDRQFTELKTHELNGITLYADEMNKWILTAYDEMIKQTQDSKPNHHKLIKKIESKRKENSEIIQSKIEQIKEELETAKKTLKNAKEELETAEIKVAETKKELMQLQIVINDTETQIKQENEKLRTSIVNLKIKLEKVNNALKLLKEKKAEEKVKKAETAKQKKSKKKPKGKDSMMDSSFNLKRAGTPTTASISDGGTENTELINPTYQEVQTTYQKVQTTYQLKNVQKVHLKH